MELPFHFRANCYQALWASGSDQAPLWLFGLTPQSTPPSGSSETASLMLDAKTLGAALAGAKRTGHQNGVRANRPPRARPDVT